MENRVSSLVISVVSASVGLYVADEMFRILELSTGEKHEIKEDKNMIRKVIQEIRDMQRQICYEQDMRNKAEGKILELTEQIKRIKESENNNKSKRRKTQK